MKRLNSRSFSLSGPEANRVARLKRQEEIDRETQRLELRDLRTRVTHQSMWQRNVDWAAYSAARQQYTNTLIGELDAMINPPQPVETDADGYDDRFEDD